MRHRMNKNKSRKVFTHTAKKVHPKNNLHTRPMRGGIRL